MSILNKLLVTVTVLCLSEAAIVDKITKCSIKDTECVVKTYQEQFVASSKTGIPEFNMPIFDPLPLTNININLLEGLTLSIPHGEVKGLGGCVFQNMTVNLEKLTAFQEAICDQVSLKGDFVISGSGDIVTRVIGKNDINGNGHVKAKLEKVYISFNFPFTPVKKDDGEIYFQVGTKHVTFKYDIEKAVFSTKKVFLDGFKDDLSDLITNVLNDSWKSLLKVVDKSILNAIKDIYLPIVNMWYENIPAKYLFDEDFTSYLKK